MDPGAECTETEATLAPKADSSLPIQAGRVDVESPSSPLETPAQAFRVRKPRARLDTVARAALFENSDGDTSDSDDAAADTPDENDDIDADLTISPTPPAPASGSARVRITVPGPPAAPPPAAKGDAALHVAPPPSSETSRVGMLGASDGATGA